MVSSQLVYTLASTRTKRISMPQPPERTALYRHYDARDVLLYVGISRDPDARWKAHRGNREPWVSLAKHRTDEWHPSREEALAAEEAAIRTERPLFNGKHNYNEAPFDPDTWPTVTAHHKVHVIAELMRAEIAAGRWGVDQRIPSLRVLATAAGVRPRIVSKAAVVLQDDRVLICRPGHGIFVARPSSRPQDSFGGAVAPAAETRPYWSGPKLPHDFFWALGFPG